MCKASVVWEDTELSKTWNIFTEGSHRGRGSHMYSFSVKPGCAMSCKDTEEGKNGGWGLGGREGEERKAEQK